MDRRSGKGNLRGNKNYVRYNVRVLRKGGGIESISECEVGTTVMYQEDCFDPRSASSDDELQQNFTMGESSEKATRSQLQREYQREIRKLGFNIKVVEKAGNTLKRMLQRSDPFKLENCGKSVYNGGKRTLWWT
ncbi:Hypothetical predicted protein [Paramuricea clavata]|uniref:Uncharacterized protein n=1 Tax=Paramuricea clavata TaxID=317549 RepID=A0A7D9E6K0_PARCT|nr:Hypothetical predicted protein [Paramuricea clavata]